MSNLFELDGMQDRADGIDFIPIFCQDLIPPILATYTKEEFEKVVHYPKSNRRYWVMQGWKPPT